ncbi:BTA121 domain-containing protein surface lipoprotein [Borrelia venezuelensis]|uniref:BTA121 domain-containing protein surface lipoprotein n=1 Tax=Borrelia venezuelensis TaxID=1653839 RepID=UPI001FF6746A|nr:hypothetical protein [Borrelia venezuelensis]UPA12700.1 hypothetical protein bvRMA01_001035 [Borrelia venezuelensis]
MIKVKHLGEFLALILILLFLLIISCNLESQGDIAFREDLTVEGSLKKLKKPVVDDITVKINTLLDSFGIFDDERDVINNIQIAITDPKIGNAGDIGSAGGFKTYDMDEFYNLLDGLGSLKLREIIKFHSNALEVQVQAEIEARSVIDSVKGDVLKQRLENMFNQHKDYCLSYLKWLFNDPNPDTVYFRVINDNYVDKFSKIKDRIQSVVEDAKQYAGWMSASELEAIAFIRDILTDPSIVGYGGLKTYSNSEFYNLLRNLGDTILKEIIQFHLNNLRTENAALVAIENLQENYEKQQLQYKLYFCKLKYTLYLKELFGEPTSDDIYRKFLVSRYDFFNLFAKLESDALGIMRGKELYSGRMSSSELAVIWYILLVITDPDIGVPTIYNYERFYNLLDHLGDVKVKVIIQNIQKTLKAQDEAKTAIEDVNDVNLKQKLESDLKEKNSAYVLALKEAFGKLNYDSIYQTTKNVDYVNWFNAIKDTASSSI